MFVPTSAKSGDVVGVTVGPLNRHSHDDRGMHSNICWVLAEGFYAPPDQWVIPSRKLSPELTRKTAASAMPASARTGRRSTPRYLSAGNTSPSMAIMLDRSDRPVEPQGDRPGPAAEFHASVGTVE